MQGGVRASLPFIIFVFFYGHELCKRGMIIALFCFAVEIFWYSLLKCFDSMRYNMF